MKKFVLPIVIAVVGVVTISMLVVAKPKPTPRPAPGEPANVQVDVTPATPNTENLAVTAQGTVTPKREINLVAQVSGQVVKVENSFTDGGFFDTQELLIQIDDRDYRAALLSAQSRLAEAEQRLAQEEGVSRQAKREWRDLGDESANDLFMRKPQLAAASAALAAAKADLEVASLNLERTRITVPFAGRVKETMVDLGQYVSVGTQLATVYDSSVVEVRVPLTEQQAALIDLPLIQSISVDQRPEVIVRGVVAGHETQWLGHLVRTDAFVDTQSRMYNAVVEVVDPFAAETPLLPGLFVEVLINGKAIDNVVKLPRSALFKRNQLLTLNGDNEIEQTQVRVLRKNADYVWVKGDLAADTLVSLEKQSLTPIGSVVDPLVDDKPTDSAAPAQVAVVSEQPGAAAKAED
ncbi:efflux RND transporter periplasmic adaptor subunit [Gilvimarinus sp. SDUM040013]|uniref:Efflux RND transporter periplasmic adaptor subunit n=1 Tax=Gilvimarinus gilvus TaxID=3058038 RepID=A0ABU4S294_9GAMM|nr:efflux RND transporter periplasmic adaptor subunit [Gilvimarinus sp. SDUM040013]MDO3386364.1 efflux RND transporter periplasmic adaptor subunit [Gilvimarinus sp. SDUM040013]MDX6849978.1 efflux RND transporter periplasmic adaptor subunit [Gilvimarinus sp. SDUM040013]